MTLWDEQQYLHLVSSNYIHGVGQFLPWYRYYMIMHEKTLQKYCNYKGGMPYWDEQVDAENIIKSTIWDAVYRIGGSGNISDSDSVTDGPFAYTKLHIGAGSFNSVVPKVADYYLNRSISITTFQAASQANVDMQIPVLSPSGPLSFLHHTNLDRLWWERQSASLTSCLTDIGGNNVPTT
ncbi:hypothetical protein BGZ60DRAFT_425285 [Tricladium varicosporioides]|nr:hypothetical protein BGZ60DRAFT_425285 [Hymenoscyphus varicosporioides]